MFVWFILYITQNLCTYSALDEILLLNECSLSLQYLGTLNTQACSSLSMLSLHMVWHAFLYPKSDWNRKNNPSTRNKFQKLWVWFESTHRSEYSLLISNTYSDDKWVFLWKHLEKNEYFNKFVVFATCLINNALWK